MGKVKPYYQQIAEELEREIISGEYKAGAKMPTEKVLQERFFVSRMTIRQAYQLLEKKGAVVIERNRGAFVSDVTIQRNQEILGFSELMKRKGFNCTSKIARLEKALPNERLREILQLEEGEEIYYLYRYRYANEELVAIEQAHIVAKFVPHLEMFNFEKYSLYDVFYWQYGLNLSWAKDEISADIITGENAKMMLGARSGPALIVRNSAFINSNVPIEYTEQIYNYKVFSYTVISTEISKRYLDKDNK